MGSAVGKMTFLENSHPDMSSFLPLGPFGWGEVTHETSVEVNTVDRFCYEQGIEEIDVLKSDTQGFELEVFKGAEETIRAKKIRLIYCEMNFVEMYKNMPSFTRIYDFLTDHDFLLVSFYKLQRLGNLASHTDMLFVHKDYSDGIPSQ